MSEVMRCKAEDRLMKELQRSKRVALLASHSHVTRYESVKDAVYLLILCEQCASAGVLAYLRTSTDGYTFFTGRADLQPRQWEEFDTAAEGVLRDAIMQDYEERRDATRCKAKDN